MPYINKDERQLMDEINYADIAAKIDTPGKLNYILTRIILSVLMKFGLNYDNLSIVGGVLQDVRDEYYRRTLALYENLKILTNGDIPEYATIMASIRTEWENEVIRVSNLQKEQSNSEATTPANSETTNQQEEKAASDAQVSEEGNTGKVN